MLATATVTVEVTADGSGGSGGSGGENGSGGAGEDGSGEGPTTVSYDYATFAEDPLSFGLTLPGLGVAVGAQDFSGFIDSDISQLRTAIARW